MVGNFDVYCDWCYCVYGCDVCFRFDFCDFCCDLRVIFSVGSECVCFIGVVFFVFCILRYDG